MAEKPKYSSIPRRRGIGFFRQFIDNVRLSWALVRDPRVPLRLKLILVAAVIYVVSPLDIIPDIIPVLGQLDDLGIIMAAMTLFNNMAPAEIVAEYTERFQSQLPFKVERDEKGKVIDVKPQPVEEPQP